METVLNIQQQYTIEFIYSKHLSNKRYKFENRNDILILVREIMCECITKSLNLERCVRLMTNVFNLTPEELSIIMNENVMQLIDHTLLDVSMKLWSIGAYDSLHFGSYVVDYFMRCNRFNDVKLLVSLGAKTVLQSSIPINNSIYCKSPPDITKIIKFVYGKLLYQDRELLKYMRKYKRNLQKGKKYYAKYSKEARIELYNSHPHTQTKNTKRIEKRKEWLCCICLDNTHKSKYVLPVCKHKFHSDCFIKYILKNKNSDNLRCPFCRTLVE
jgi:hypothetical protein